MPIFPHCVALALVLGPTAPPSAAATEASTPAPAPAPAPAPDLDAKGTPPPEPAAALDSDAEANGWEASPSESTEGETAAEPPALGPAVMPAPTVAHQPVPQPIVDDSTQDTKWRHRQRNHYKGMSIGGMISFGAGYGFSLMVAVASRAGFPTEDADFERERAFSRRMAIPLAGPFAALPVANTSADTRVIIVGLGVAQVAGLAIGIAGLVKLREFPDPDKRAVAFHAMPTRNGAQVGLSGRF